jgi:hypothetical protein
LKDSHVVGGKGMNKGRGFIAATLFFAMVISNAVATAQQQPQRRRPPATQASGSINTSESRLTGSYQLDVASSDDASAAAERALGTSAFGIERSAIDSLTRRLTSPEKISIERRGQVINLASTRAPRISFEADGRERTEPAADGRVVRTRAVLYGDELMISSSGSRDNDYSVTFSPVDQGRRLRITRRIYSEEVGQSIVVQSFYDKISNAARWSVYGEPESERTATARNIPRSSPRDGGRNLPRPAPPAPVMRQPQPTPDFPERRNDSYDSYALIIPDGTQFVATLDNDLSTERSRENDRFTLTVRSPVQFEGATIEGYVSQVERAGTFSGRSEMKLDFSQIRLRDGRTAEFSGVIENIDATNGEDVRIDRESATTVEQGGSSRTNRTTQRAAIGAAVGAIIGAITDGGKGAAIGAAIGAGVGAGSVYIQGRDDLELNSGTQLTVRASRRR